MDVHRVPAEFVGNWNLSWQLYKQRRRTILLTHSMFRICGYMAERVAYFHVKKSKLTHEQAGLKDLKVIHGFNIQKASPLIAHQSANDARASFAVRACLTNRLGLASACIRNPCKCKEILASCVHLLACLSVSVQSFWLRSLSRCNLYWCSS